MILLSANCLLFFGYRSSHVREGVTLNADSHRIATAFMPWNRAPKPTSEAACRRQWPSFVPANTPLGQPLGQISDVLSVTYAICPRISQKKSDHILLGLPSRSAVGVRGSEIPTCCKTRNRARPMSVPNFLEAACRRQRPLSRAPHAPAKY